MNCPQTESTVTCVQHELQMARWHFDAAETNTDVAMAIEAVVRARSMPDQPQVIETLNDAFKALKDVLVMRCCCTTQPNDRNAFIMAVDSAFGGELDLSMHSEMLLSYKKVMGDRPEAFQSNSASRGPKRARRRPWEHGVHNFSTSESTTPMWIDRNAPASSFAWPATSYTTTFFDAVPSIALVRSTQAESQQSASTLLAADTSQHQ